MRYITNAGTWKKGLQKSARNMGDAIRFGMYENPCSRMNAFGTSVFVRIVDKNAVYYHVEVAIHNIDIQTTYSLHRQTSSYFVYIYIEMIRLLHDGHVYCTQKNGGLLVRTSNWRPGL